jgi:hypothetical protein
MHDPVLPIGKLLNQLIGAVGINPSATLHKPLGQLIERFFPILWGRILWSDATDLIDQ